MASTTYAGDSRDTVDLSRIPNGSNGPGITVSTFGHCVDTTFDNKYLFASSVGDESIYVFGTMRVLQHLSIYLSNVSVWSEKRGPLVIVGCGHTTVKTYL